MALVTVIPSLGDNFVYLYECGDGQVVAVDPGEVDAVLRALEPSGLRLVIILCTHHHWDHVGGVAELKRLTGCEVVAGDGRRIVDIDRVVCDGDVVEVGGVEIEVIGTPGHTLTSVCYHVRRGDDGRAVVWTGDTMFTCGCGRIFECDRPTMYESLQKLASLSDDTLVYPGHDYTLENCEFAYGIEPENDAVRKRLEDVRRCVRQGGVTVGSTMGLERLTNPFLRADEDRLAAAVGMVGAESVEVFAELRRRKDAF